MTPTAIPPQSARKSELRALAWLFLKLGTISFGGPAAHIALMEDDVVRRRKWLTREEFLDYVGATNLIPGPNSTELAIHIGHARAGWPGLLVAGGCFIFPATIIVGTIAWAYVRFGALPEVAGILYGVKPVVIAIVVQALVGLGRTALRTRLQWALAVVCVVAAAFGMNELGILLAAGVAMAVIAARPRGTGGGTPTQPLLSFGPLIPGSVPVSSAAIISAPVAFGLWPLFGVFLKIGAVLFGSGYVLLAFLRTDLVQRLGWLTEHQLLDAVAVGQVTPGPVFTTATFVGYLLGGAGGALVATVGIFLPAFVFVALSGPLVPRIRRSPVAGAVLDGVNVASLALMLVVSWQLGGAAISGWLTAVIAALSGVLLIRYRVGSTWLIFGGALMGFAAHWLTG